MQPKALAHCVQCTTHYQFWLCVLLLDGPHISGSLLGSQDIQGLTPRRPTRHVPDVSPAGVEVSTRNCWPEHQRATGCPPPRQSFGRVQNIYGRLQLTRQVHLVGYANETTRASKWFRKLNWCSWRIERLLAPQGT